MSGQPTLCDQPFLRYCISANFDRYLANWPPCGVFGGIIFLPPGRNMLVYTMRTHPEVFILVSANARNWGLGVLSTPTISKNAFSR